MIDTTATEPPRNWFLELTSTPTEDLLRHAEHLRAKLAHAQERGHRVDARAYELRLLDVERAVAVHNRRATEALDQRQTPFIDIVFDGPPGQNAGRFVEVEDHTGASVQVGEWLDRGDGFYVLRIPRGIPSPASVGRNSLRDAWIAAVQWAFERPATEREVSIAVDYAAGHAPHQPALTADEVRAVVREVVGEELSTNNGTWSEMIDAIATRAAKELAGAVVSEEQRDRIVTIADEAFGLGPVEPMDETLTRIERGIHEAHRRSENELSDLRQRLAAATAAGELVTAERDALQGQREADLREAFLAGAEWMRAASALDQHGQDVGAQIIEPTEDQIAVAAAEYARSKAGG